MTLKTVTWRRNQHHILWVWISVSNHNGGEGFLINLQPANSSASPLRCFHPPSKQSLWGRKMFHFHSYLPSVWSWTCREPQWSQVEQRGKYSYCGNLDDRWGRDVSEPCEAAFLCCKGLPVVVTHPCRVSCYFHFFPLQQLINIFTSVLMDLMVFFWMPF